MDSSLHEVWQAASGSPFVPTVGKDSQFLIAFVLLILGFALGGAFTLSRSCPLLHDRIALLMISLADRSVVNLPVLAVPASLALAYVNLHARSPAPMPDARVHLTLLPGSAWSTCSVRSEFTSKIPKPLAESVP
jgi:hypothetical protein